MATRRRFPPRHRRQQAALPRCRYRSIRAFAANMQTWSLYACDHESLPIRCHSRPAGAAASQRCRRPAWLVHAVTVPLQCRTDDLRPVFNRAAARPSSSPLVTTARSIWIDDEDARGGAWFLLALGTVSNISLAPSIYFLVAPFGSHSFTSAGRWLSDPGAFHDRACLRHRDRTDRVTPPRCIRGRRRHEQVETALRSSAACRPQGARSDARGKLVRPRCR